MNPMTSIALQSQGFTGTMLRDGHKSWFDSLTKLEKPQKSQITEWCTNYWMIMMYLLHHFCWRQIKLFGAHPCLVWVQRHAALYRQKEINSDVCIKKKTAHISVMLQLYFPQLTVKRDPQTHRIHGNGIFTYIWLIFMVNVGKCR